MTLERTGAGRPPPTYPFGALDVGSEFTIPNTHTGALMVKSSHNSRVARAAYTYAAAHNKKFHVHKRDCGGYTIRRTA